MKAIGYKQSGPITAVGALVEFEAPKPELRSHDLLVEVKGISVNPVDVKVRSAMAPEAGQTKVIGYDAAGVIREVGSDVSRFKVGDAVFYAGDLTRPGTNAELHAVDERIVGKKPTSLGFAEAAGFPLTSITAWELLFESLGVKEGSGEGESLLIIGGAGGVGSVLIQLAKQLTDLTVVATASRPDTVEWVKQMGADHVINHRESLVDQMKALEIEPRYVASLNGTEGHFPAIVELIQPRGHIALIDDPQGLDINSIKPKALSFSWEFMFTRSMFQTDDIEQQHVLLNRVSALIDDGTLISTVTNNLGAMSAEMMQEAHAQQESGRVIGKNVLDGFDS
ncbi:MULTISPECIES: zinc-binding alcohol dehydrogenase family protein [unclassified Lentimonas]|uniref:zinc-binding alcohol dehydrogenase family protein n=1 Tax=unclassified Lentimonas TaxID=2630993 RepID=UPI001325EDE2|nr:MULTISPECIES: zinc-binding alcohol dehydrogenase family protein [unclassified Lentimonas]CAA6696248.1 Bifunctional protein: zinc-containing alcohol dehydrogenase; quinone oxidoreductase (NADPH:quinone reductase) (EC; Similar to arginate lyase [Lentimonas sp. CC10]CAA6697488.1 Bifunctional protein: zinc-containing alcohol dehydrogenase; quinone oxidoreductase (NADPH:quinone reductase) (EC; Similar to arginate lyase [Lentimonas sp. CC19]CAA7071229.1 Bifunctional protein: zinc-containing alcohol